MNNGLPWVRFVVDVYMGPRNTWASWQVTDPVSECNMAIKRREVGRKFYGCVIKGCD